MEEIVNAANKLQNNAEPLLESQRKIYKHLTLKEAESYINGNLVTAARVYVANGYFLKRIRDDKLFEDDGYRNFEEYVRDRYGKDKGWASKCIKVNNMLSVEGDSPYLDRRYQDYTTYQLVELAYMDEEQREQATPDQTVKQMHDMRRTKEIPYFPIEGQMDLVMDFPEVLPDDEVVMSQLSEGSEVQTPSPVFTIDVADLVGEDDADAIPDGAAMISQQKEEPLSAYGTKKIVYPEDSLIAIEGCEGRHHCTLCSMDCQIRQKDRDCRYATCENPFPCTTMNVLENLRDEAGDECQFINHELAEITTGSHEPDPCCMECQNPCGYVCARAAHGTSEPESASGSQETVMSIVPTGEEPEPDQDNPDVIDAEFTEIPAEPVKIFDRRMLQELIDREQKMIDDLQEVWKSTQPWSYTKHVMMLQAFQNLMETGGKTKEVELVPVEQPELPVLKNNDQRKEWLDTFHDWPVWFEVPYANEVYYRYDLPDGSSIIICEYWYFAEWKTKYRDENPECTGTREYLLNPGYHYLDDCKTNRSALIEKMKEIQKKGK